MRTRWSLRAGRGGRCTGMPHIATHTPPPPAGTPNGLPPALPAGVAAPTSGVVELGAQARPGQARSGVSLLLGAAIGGVLGFLVMGPLGAVVGAAVGAGAIMLANRGRASG